jgi:GDP-mannose 6-dehydrogenase
MRVSVFGLGYVGLTSFACLADMGHDVIGVDISTEKVDLINSGVVPFTEKGLSELLRRNLGASRLSATTDAMYAILESDLSLIAVGTPGDANGAPMLTGINNVIAEIGHCLRRKRTHHTVVIRSTVLPGTCEARIAPALAEFSGRVLDKEFSLLHNPEFMREGSSIADFFDPPFTVVGLSRAAGPDRMRELYQKVNAPIIRTSWSVSEAVKYVCNLYHATKIGFANEIGAVMKSIGIDGREVMSVFAHDTLLNVSPAYLRPGFSFGGSCLPKDLRAFLAMAQERDVAMPFLSNLLPSNRQHVERAVQLVERCGSRDVALFGLAFKSGTDDLRESQNVELAKRLIDLGYRLVVYDPCVDLHRLVGVNREVFETEIPELGACMVVTPDEALERAKTIVVAHATPADIEAIAATEMRGKSIIDLQGATRLAQLPAVHYEGICW